MILTSILSLTMSASPALVSMPSSPLMMQTAPTRPGSSTAPTAPKIQPSRSTVTVTPKSSTSGPLAPYREIYCLSWRSVPRTCNLLTQMIRLEGHFHPGFQTSSLVSLPNPATIAAQTKTMPPGRAAIQWWRYSNSLFYPDPLSGPAAPAPAFPLPWDTNAVNAVTAEWNNWLQQFKNAGGRLDVLVGDCERWGMFSSWSLTNAQIQRIASDTRANQPYYSSPALTKLLDGTNVSMVKSFTQTTDYAKWDCAMGTLTAAAMKKSVWDPAAALFPGLRGSNYAGMQTTTNPAFDLNGHPILANNIVGTAASPVAYGEMEHIATAWFIDPSDSTKLSKTGTKKLDRTPWNAFLLDVQKGRACKRNAPNIPLQPWIAFQGWRGRIAGFVPYPSDLRYHDEMVRHFALLGTEVFLYWNPESNGVDSDINWTETERTAGATRLNGVLADLNSRLDGVVFAAATTEPLRLDSVVVTSGAQRRDGKWIWRTTVSPEVRRLRNLTTNAVVSLDATGVGRWDVTDTSTAPRYAVDTTPVSLVTGTGSSTP
jgi:hypothetical protein